MSLKVDGLHSQFKIKCWGDNSHQQLDIPGMEETKQFDTGASHLCAIYALKNTVRCWGANKAGQADPHAATTGSAAYVLKLSAGFQHTCALNGNLDLFCWGWQTGVNGLLAVPKGVQAIEVATGWGHNCVLSAMRVLKCWGSDEWGQLQVPAGVGLRV